MNDTPGAQHVTSRLMRESLMDKKLIAGTESAVRAILPTLNVVQIGGLSIMDRGHTAVQPLLDAKSSAQNAYMVSCLLANHGFVYLEAPFIVQLLPAMLAAARGAVFNGIPPYDLWEHPPALGKIPPHGSDAGSYLVGEVFGARSVILLKDVDGLYSADPKTSPDATFIPDIGAAELIGMKLPTLPIEPVVLELLTRARLVKSVRIVNGLVPGNLTRALNGEAVGTLIHA
jgi:molybdenum storage protein